VAFEVERLTRVLLALVVLGVACIPRAHAQDGSAGYAASGCGGCHGTQGRGSALGPALTGATLSVEAFVAYVRRPTGAMIAFPAAAVSDDDLEAMHNWLASVDSPRLPSGNAERGAAVFRRNGCYQCHANEGQGGAQGPRLGPNPVSLQRLIWYSRHPSRAMPPYAEAVMSDQDFADVHAFLASRPAPPPLEDLPLLRP
jgi:mono/diheme cytochrome c family protein